MQDDPDRYGRDRLQRDRHPREGERDRRSSGRPYGDGEYASHDERQRESADRSGVPYEDTRNQEESSHRPPPSYGTYPAGSFGERNWAPGYSRQWSSESWRVPGPFSGRGPRGYQRSDERIREEVNERLTMHGLVDASDVEVQVEHCEVTLSGFVDSRNAKHAAEDCAEQVPGVRDVHNRLRIRTTDGDQPPSPTGTAAPRRGAPRSRSRTT